MPVLQVKLAFPAFILLSVNLILATFTFFYAVRIRIRCDESQFVTATTDDEPDEVLRSLSSTQSGYGYDVTSHNSSRRPPMTNQMRLINLGVQQR
ncbi:hypothetical protein QE152_g7917 [Popillia japonica]|uniref:Uncharacterized protein n=1 Tax=Popillia japonica TaxID=7064 RepID=A0AAW1M6Z1_POPJA